MFSLLLASHLISDFIFQSNFIINLKKRSLLKGNLIHTIIVGITQFIIILYFSLLVKIKITEVFLIVILVVVSHFIIDIIKSLLHNKLEKHPKMDFWVFTLDQILHLIFIYFISVTIKVDLTYYDFTLYLISIYIFTILVANYTIDKLWKIINNSDSKNNVSDNKDSEISGYIGIIERIIMLTGMILGIYESIIVVVAIKSLIRLKDDKIKSDFYILGSLMSLLFVFIGFILFESLIDIYNPGSILEEFLKLLYK